MFVVVLLLLLPLSTEGFHVHFKKRTRCKSRTSIGNGVVPLPSASTRRMGEHAMAYRIGTSTTSLSSSSQKNEERRDDGIDYVTRRYMYLPFALISVLSWMAVSTKVLSFHPDPKFIHCTLQHNILTMAQAWAFQVPVMFGSIVSLADQDGGGFLEALHRCTVVIASLLLLVHSLNPAPFAFGYDLIQPRSLRVLTALGHGIAALGIIVLGVCFPKRKVASSNEELQAFNVMDIFPSLALVGWACFSFLSVWPLATVPTFLGKRLSRPAALFFCVAAANVLQRKGHHSVSTGSQCHVLLIVLKILGVDDGGVLLPGRGLWKWYPALVATPRATTLSLMTHVWLVCHISGCPPVEWRYFLWRRKPDVSFTCAKKATLREVEGSDEPTL